MIRMKPYFQWFRGREGQHSILSVTRDDLFWNLYLPFRIRTILRSSRHRLLYLCTGKMLDLYHVSYPRFTSEDY